MKNSSLFERESRLCAKQHSEDRSTADSSVLQLKHELAWVACTQCLTPGGTALIAAKALYFGLDGGTLPLRNLVRDVGGGALTTVASVTEGVAREVIEWTPR